MADLSQYTLPNDTDVCLLDCVAAFAGLTEQEKKYAHYLSQASFHGSLICLFQTSPESPGIFLLLQKLFRAQTPEELRKLALSEGFTEAEIQALMIYAAAIYTNMGNYKSFGDSKIVPNLPKEKFAGLVQKSNAATADPSGMQALLTSVLDRMYSLSEQERELGLSPKGTTTYFSPNCDKEDAEFAQEFLTAKDISPYNTRLFKRVDPATKSPVYEVRLASSEAGDGEVPGLGKILGRHKFQSKDKSREAEFLVTRGDYSPLMALVCQNLAHAKSHAANDHERAMLEEYIKSFTTGSNDAHKDGSRHWIKNRGPIVETYIGFIESYRDPVGVRGEFEGFVAVVNKDMSAKFTELVENAEHLLAHLPWPAEYEKDRFLKPDFTSLDVLSFGSSGIPAGINIPNYDDIRQNEGFKNVSLGNVLTSGYKDTKITFLSAEDRELYARLKLQAFEVQVGLHELLGHGSGKLFIKDEDGKFNFDIEHLKHTETGNQITSWYEAGETWDTKFQSVASTYEECRAECVGLYLCLSTEILKIFGHTGDDADDLIYINWLNMARAGLLALEFYTPETQAWRQAHMNARFVILRVLLEAGEDFVQIKRTTGEDGNPDILLTLDRTKIISVGKPAIGNFLRKLQVYKSTADKETGTAMYKYYSDVHDNEEPHFLSLRSIVLERKQPRKMFVQHHTYLEGDTVQLKSYDPTPAGVVHSFVDRFPSTDIDTIIQGLLEKDRSIFQCCCTQ